MLLGNLDGKDSLLDLDLDRRGRSLVGSTYWLNLVRGREMD